MFDLIKVRVRMGCNCQKLEVHAKVCGKQLLRHERACTAKKISCLFGICLKKTSF